MTVNLSKISQTLLNILKDILIWLFILVIIYFFYPLIKFWIDNFMM